MDIRSDDLHPFENKKIIFINGGNGLIQGIFYKAMAE